jgi:hypothetical protein
MRFADQLYKSGKLNDLNHRNKLLALYCGVVGIMVASYSNSVFSQFPTSLICYASMCFIFLAERELKSLKKI